MKVKWTHTAVEHMMAIYEYIVKDSPVYAKRVVDKLIKLTE
jgi:plasmid stabilization system protein ParE